jgi:hypothetical protein
MRKWLLVVGLATAALVGIQTEAQAWVRFGINIGIPVYRPYPCYGPYPYYYGPYYQPYVYAAPPPVYAAPGPVVYQPTAVVVSQPPPAVPQPIPTVSQPAPQPSPPRNASYSEQPAGTWSADPKQANVDHLLQQLANADERNRADAAMELGRMRADRAVDGLTTMLAADKSAQARETAARALGLIAAPRSLNALQQAAMADGDREVRHSAQFSAEVIRANLRRD